MGRSIFYYTHSEALGGAEESLLMLIETLDRSAWQPTLLVADSPVAALLTDRARALDVPVLAVEAMPLGAAGAARVPGFVRALRSHRPDVFHANLSSPLAAKFALASAVLSGVPAVVGTVQLVPPFPLTRSSILQLRALAARVGRFLAVSRAIQRQLIDQLHWPADKVEVVYNAVRSTSVEPGCGDPLRAELTRGRDLPVVLTTARLDDQKGHAILLEAAAQLPGVIFVLAGEGPERAAIEARVSELGLGDRVRLLGQRRDIPELLAASDVFALPSLYEGSSLSVLEAMAAGRAVVSSAIPGTDELILDGDSGLLVAPGDPAALAAALRRVLAYPPLREGLGRRARERVQADFTAEGMARSVTSVYEQLLGTGAAAALGSEQRNALMRAADWRFLLRQAQRPTAVSLADGRAAQALPLISDPPASTQDHADLVLIGEPRPEDLARARTMLRPGGELYCESRFPRLAGGARLRRTLRRAGFDDVRLHWAGPRIGHRPPQFWMPLGSSAVASFVLHERRPHGIVSQLARVVWRFALRTGSLAPVGALARRSDGAPPALDELDQLLSVGGKPVPLLLLTGGSRSINKVVGLPFERGEPTPSRVVKFARVPEAEPGLAHEADMLRAIEADHPRVPGVPRVLGVGRRAGRLAVLETAVHGRSLLGELSPATLPRLAAAVTDWLVLLAGPPEPQARAGWWERVVQASLDTFADQFGPVLRTGLVERAREQLETLDVLPVVVEHRDCSPWNVVLLGDGTPALLDWESAEAHGLPGLDLVYFLTNSVFVLEGALEARSTREVYRRLLDPRTPYGRVMAASMDHYCQALELDPSLLPALRLLTWIVHARSDFRHVELDDPGGTTRATLERSPFLGLVREELF